MKNQMFDGMFAAAKARLEGRSAEALCRLGNVKAEGGALVFESMGQAIRMAYPECAFSPAVNAWQALVILHYFAAADGTPAAGRTISFSEYKDGLARGAGFDRDVENAIRAKTGAHSEAALKQRCAAMGARWIQSNADFCAEFRFMPNYPIWLKIWFADDEFSTSGKLLVDASAAHYLSVEDAVTVGELILNRAIG